MTTRTEPIYRRCYECGTEWTTAALVAAHNVIVDQVNADAGDVVADRVSDPDAVHCCPECIHDW